MQTLLNFHADKPFSEVFIIMLSADEKDTGTEWTEEHLGLSEKHAGFKTEIPHNRYLHLNSSQRRHEERMKIHHVGQKLHQFISLITCQTALNFDKFWHTCALINFL